jgi:hypothetical protein
MGEEALVAGYHWSVHGQVGADRLAGQRTRVSYSNNLPFAAGICADAVSSKLSQKDIGVALRFASYLADRGVNPRVFRFGPASRLE